MPYVSAIYEVTDVIIDLMKDKAGELGLRFVGSYDEKRLPRYPAVVVSPGMRTKSLDDRVSTFIVGFSVDLWVYHGNMKMPHRVRTRADLVLVREIEKVLEADLSLGGNVVQGFVVDETPGAFQANSPKSEVIAGTRMRWVGSSRRLIRENN